MLTFALYTSVKLRMYLNPRVFVWLQRETEFYWSPSFLFPPGYISCGGQTGAEDQYWCIWEKTVHSPLPPPPSSSSSFTLPSPSFLLSLTPPHKHFWERTGSSSSSSPSFSLNKRETFWTLEVCNQDTHIIQLATIHPATIHPPWGVTVDTGTLVYTQWWHHQWHHQWPHQWPLMTHM